MKRVKPAITHHEFRCQTCDYNFELNDKQAVMFMAEYHMLTHEPLKRYGNLYKKEYDDDLKVDKRLVSELRLR
jgi:hypothetical protein